MTEFSIYLQRTALEIQRSKPKWTHDDIIAAAEDIARSAAERGACLPPPADWDDE